VQQNCNCKFGEILSSGFTKYHIHKFLGHMHAWTDKVTKLNKI